MPTCTVHVQSNKRHLLAFVDRKLYIKYNGVKMNEQTNQRNGEITHKIKTTRAIHSETNFFHRLEIQFNFVLLKL